MVMCRYHTIPYGNLYIPYGNVSIPYGNVYIPKCIFMDIVFYYGRKRVVIRFILFLYGFNFSYHVVLYGNYN
ncbi:unnamed protein product [Linum tenue]|uniref:Uncharacterized protein n=1 Tax=Linum tenue TaxID=586396 RepID=A0AAV0S648_9ROSI|nr:unnamed protein product [Linum tenue]